MKPLHIDGMHGLGDNFYQRAIVRVIAQQREVSLATSWPQLYADLPVRCVRPHVRLRTQAKNAARGGLAWGQRVAGESRSWHYARREGTILQALCDDIAVQLDSVDFSGPAVPHVAREPYVVVRPATVRREWRADSRNPSPRYLAQAVTALRRRFRVVSIADLQPGEEWALDPLPPADERFHAGELQLEELLKLVAGAAAVVGGVGWLVPAAIAYRRPMFLVFGGWGRHNGPARIFDPRLDTSLIHQAIPDHFCMCSSATHACDKRITDIEAHIEHFTLRVAENERTAVAA